MPAAAEVSKGWRVISRLKTVLPERLKHIAYRLPKEHLGRLRSLGVTGYFFIHSWAAEMERSVASLPPLDSQGEPVDLWYLTGSRFWYQTAYCAWTFGRHTGRPIRLHLVDDGTLEACQVQSLRRVFGVVEVVYNSESAKRLHALLPAPYFPTLNRRWNDYIHLRKLIDVHLGRHGPRLVLDSDMLFFARPTLLLAWLAEADSRPPIYMTDCIESYGYSRRLLETLSGFPLPHKLNVGICGLNSSHIIWTDLERWCARLLSEEGTSYYLEQALVAMIASRTPGVQAEATEYITLPSSTQVATGAGVMQHFVAGSKSDYFRYGWKVARKKCGC